MNTNAYFSKESIVGGENFLIISGHWNEDIEAFVLNNKIDSLYLNYALGWQDNNVSFLESLGHLKKLKIIAHEIENLEVINQLHNLKYLSLDVSSKFKASIDFSNFPELSKCSFHWLKGSRNLSCCQSLEKLFLYDYPCQTLETVFKLKNLQELHVISSRRIDNIYGIEGLCLLTQLELSYLYQLSCISPLSTLSQLTHLEIHSCKKINDIEALSTLINLKTLLLENLDDITSLKPLKSCSNLEYLGLTDSTKILDGDFNFLKEFPRLKTIVYKNRKHYSDKRQDLQSILDRHHSSEKRDW
jgi:hypothetical protein